MEKKELISSKKKVLILITKGNFGGAQRYVYEIATNIPKNDFDVVVACGEGETLKNKLRESGIRVIEIRSSKRNINIIRDIKLFFELLKIIKQEKPDVLHLNSSKIGGIGSVIGRIQKVPNIVFTAHGWAFNENRNILSKIIIKFLHSVTILLSHRTIAVAEKIKTSISSFSFIKNKMVIIYNGIKNYKLLTAKESSEKLGIEKDKMVIISIAELHSNKGLDIAIKSISLLSKKMQEKINYLIIGNGEERDSLEKLIRDLDLENNVRLVGFLPDAKIFLSAANIFLLPSRTEALPYVILEAGLAGLPIIATSVGGIPEIIKDMQNGILVPPNNSKEIAEAISYYLDHKDKQKEFGKNIKQTILELFPFSKMISETLKIYNS